MGHMLAASADLIDLMHTHPIYVTDSDGSKQLQFYLFFRAKACIGSRCSSSAKAR